MTLAPSLLLGSAAGIVAVASAQAADLPTRKAAPVEYVRVCNVGGITGWTLPGSDTCVKFSGFMTAHFIAGNLSNQYNSAGSDRVGASTRRLIRLPLLICPRSSWFKAAITAGPPGSDLQRFHGRPDHRAPTTSTVAIGGVPTSIVTPGAQVQFRTSRMRFSIAMRSAGTSEPTSALISLRTPPMARSTRRLGQRRMIASPQQRQTQASFRKVEEFEMLSN